MAKPYSIDLRERAVAAVLPGGLSRHRAAAQFGLAVSTVVNWVRRFRETGSVAPGQMGGHKPKAIAGDHRVFLARRVREGGFTLRGLVSELAERGLKVDYRSVWNFVHAERLSFVPLSRYRVPKIAQHAAFGHMNDYDLETQSCGWVVELARLTIASPGVAARSPGSHAAYFLMVQSGLSRHS